MKLSISNTITFKTLVNVVEVDYLVIIILLKNIILWNKRYGRQNFNSLSQLNSKRMVLDIPKVTTYEN